jgi:hypothetical protein
MSGLWCEWIKPNQSLVVTTVTPDGQGTQLALCREEIVDWWD